MSRAKADSLLTLTQSFFLGYLQSTRGASPHTVRAYRDALKLFFQHLASQKRKRIADLQLDDIQAEAVLTFLDHIESKRSNSAVTRNCRLAAIRSFVQHLLRHDVTRAAQYGRVLAIGNKRAMHRAVAYLEPEEARAVIAAVDTSSSRGRRNHALLLFLYNTGARVSEALAVRPSDLRLERPRHVRLLGKGKKERACPLWPETAAALRRIAHAEASGEPVFQSRPGMPLTRDGVAYLLQEYRQPRGEEPPVTEASSGDPTHASTLCRFPDYAARIRTNRPKASRIEGCLRRRPFDIRHSAEAWRSGLFKEGQQLVVRLKALGRAFDWIGFG